MKIFKRISVKLMIDGTKQTAKRFPLPVIFSILTAVLLIFKIEDNSIFKNIPALDKLIFISILGFGFTLISTLFLEKCEKRDNIKYLTQLIVLSFLGYLYITLPVPFRETDYIIFSVLQTASIISLMFVFSRKGDDEKYFGTFNVIITVRAFISFIFSGIMFIGLASALFAIQELFLKNNFHEELYGDLWVTLAVFFAPVYFLSGIPEKDTPIDDHRYPVFLKILLQYFIIPLVCFYLLILYIYGIKIIFTQNWPAGIVSYLIISYAFVGIFSIILTSPLARKEKFEWLRTFSKYFFRALLPLIVLLYMAILQRTFQYGVTEKRYFIIALAVWLTGVSLYYIFSRRKSLKIMPITLSIVSILSVYGPWSCFSISKYSQSERLTILLEEHGLLKDGKIYQTEKEIPFDDRKNISSKVSYFYDNHGITSVDYLKKEYQRLALKNRKDSLHNDPYYHYRDRDMAVTRSRFVKKAFGFDYINQWQNSGSMNYINYMKEYNTRPSLELIEKYEYALDTESGILRDSLKLEKYRLWIKYDYENAVLSFEGDSTKTVDLNLENITKERFAPFTNSNYNNRISKEEMTFEISNAEIDCKIIFYSFTFNKPDEKKEYSFSNPRFIIYFRLNQGK